MLGQEMFEHWFKVFQDWRTFAIVLKAKEKE